MKAILAGLALVVLAVTAASAQQQCAPRDEVLAWLASKYGEAPVAAGINGADRIVELLAAEGGRTWTLIVTRADGVSCVLGDGEDWTDDPPGKPAVKGEDS